MWSRAQLKEKAKMSLKANYWKALLVTLIVFVIGGASSSFNFELSDDNSSDSGIFEEFENFLEDENVVNQFSDVLIITGGEDKYSDQYANDENSKEYIEGYYDGYNGDTPVTDVPGDYSDGYNDGVLDAQAESIYNDYYDDSMDESLSDAFDSIFELQDYSRFFAFAGIVVVALLVVVLVAAVIGVFISAFVYNPLEVGTNRFFVKNLNEAAEVKEVAFAFDHSYMNVVKILFIRNMCIFGWSLLFVIPGIVKAYEYMMIPYLLAENPSMSKEQAFALSKQMMTGNKWNAFILELSFIGWDFLSALTVGILNIFYVQPYKSLTYAALYEELSLINGRPAFAGQPNMEQNYYQFNPYAQTDSNGQSDYEYQADALENTYETPNQGEM